MKGKVKVSQGKERQMLHTKDRRGLQGQSWEVGSPGEPEAGKQEDSGCLESPEQNAGSTCHLANILAGTCYLLGHPCEWGRGGEVWLQGFHI